MANVNVLIAFYSRNGSTEALAKVIGEGARSEDRGAERTQAEYERCAGIDVGKRFDA
jgi:flavodoxin